MPAQSSMARKADDHIETHHNTRCEIGEAAPSTSSRTPEGSENEQNEEPKNHWKARKYLLLTVGLAVLGVGTGDIVDSHVTPRPRRLSAHAPAAARAHNVASELPM
jgi:hypothetical protein